MRCTFAKGWRELLGGGDVVKRSSPREWRAVEIVVMEKKKGLEPRNGSFKTWGWR